jgi:flagellin-like hook-associated protein FlgL
MRITRNTLWDALKERLHTSTRRLADAQEEVTTGIRVNRPSDDPSAAVRLVGLKSELANLDRYRENAEEAVGRLESGAEALRQISELLSEARSLGQWGATGTNGPTDREAIARDIDSLLDQAISLANTRFGRTWVFAGETGSELPYVRDEATGRIVFTGEDAERHVPISPGLNAPADMPGSSIFGGRDRGVTTFYGSTGAGPGEGTDSGRGRATLTLTHVDTVFGDGAGAGGGDSVSGVTAGASSPGGDTILGNHTLNLTVNAAGTGGTVALDGGPSIAFTSSSSADLAVPNGDGDVVHVDLRGVTAGYNGNVTLLGNGELSTDGGSTRTAIDFTSAQAVIDSRTNEVTHVDTRSVVRTGVERVDYEGTFDVFAALEALRDELRNVDGRDESELSDAIGRRVGTLVEVHDDVLLALGTVGARAERMSASASQLSDLGLQLDRLRSNLEDTDITEAVVELSEQENLFQAALAVGARLAQPTLLDYL